MTKLHTHYLRAGFTLIELIVVLGITVILATILISYNHTTQQQLSLYADQMKFVQTIFRAKSLALTPSLQTASVDICGYGVHIDYPATKYFLFSYKKPSPTTDCQSINNIDPTAEIVITASDANRNIKFIEENGTPRLDDVLFIPPDPKTLVGSGGTAITSGNASVIMQTQDGTLKSAPIIVNPAGLIDF